MPCLPSAESMRTIYLDNSATTALSREAREAMCAAMEVFGNPSSLHAEGARAAALLRDCRRTVGEALGERFLKDGQLIFTSSGTEANALALQGAAHAKARRDATTILTTDSEHPSVENNLRVLEAEGFRVVRISTRGGALDMEAVRACCSKDLFMVSMMLVNNETGALYPVREVFAMARAANPDCICHTDAVQGFFKVPCSPRALGADLMTVSGHKIHGPKGVGALYVSERMLTAKRLVAYLAGGGQEFGFRSGTENTVGIAGFAAAARALGATWRQDAARMAALRDRISAALSGSEIRVNRPATAAPHILSLTLPQIKSETMLHFLSERGIAVSSGSACSSHAKKASSTLLAFGLPADEADTTVRISLGRENDEADADALVKALLEGVRTLVRIRR